MTNQTQTKSKGTMFFHDPLIKSYQLARDFAGKEGRVATMPDAIDAKLLADPNDPSWTRYISTTSGEFYGHSKGSNPIIVVAHGIDDLLNNKSIIDRSGKAVRIGSLCLGTFIHLTNPEFRKLECGSYCPVEVLDLDEILKMRKYPGTALPFDQAMADKLLHARLGPKTEAFLRKHQYLRTSVNTSKLIRKA